MSKSELESAEAILFNSAIGNMLLSAAGYLNHTKEDLEKEKEYQARKHFNQQLLKEQINEHRS